MPNKRASNKTRVTVPMEDSLEKQISLDAEKHGIDRVQAIKEMCRWYLAHKPKGDK